LSLRLDVRVIPRSPRNAIETPRGGRLIVRVTAPPVDDAANEAVVNVIAEAYRVPRSRVRIVSGGRSRNKTVEIG
jgi:uncharacterized protein (TIGR00251 family)